MIMRSGVVVAGAAAVLLAAGTWADYPELVMLGLAGVATREISPFRVPVGITARGMLTVTNTAVGESSDVRGRVGRRASCHGAVAEPGLRRRPPRRLAAVAAGPLESR